MFSNFRIVAEKESYILTGPDENGIIKSHKLAEINVKVVDNATGEPLQGVLLSLTGGEKYRKNSMTGEAGSLSFYSLSPGEYFLRPMMKEYKFNPSSQIIEIKEGVTKFIELRYNLFLSIQKFCLKFFLIDKIFLIVILILSKIFLFKYVFPIL